MKTRKENLITMKKLTVIAISIALIVISFFIPWVNAFMPLIVLIIICQSFDIKMAATIGFIFGFLSFLFAVTRPSSVFSLIFQNPLVSILPRLLVGILVYLIYNGMNKFLKKVYFQKYDKKTWIESKHRLDYYSMIISSFSAAFINTVLVIGTLLIIFNNKTLSFGGKDTVITFKYIIGIVIVAAPLEWILCPIIAPPISRALKKAKVF